jgi:hypothetical protein
LQHDPTGRVTRKELEYGRHDVDRTVALLNAMKLEYDGFALDLPPENAMSAASITKAFLSQMNVTEPARKFHFPDEVLGKYMQAYRLQPPRTGQGRWKYIRPNYFWCHTDKV